MINVTSYRGHIRNWEALCKELSIDLGLSREDREKEILVKAYEKWDCDMAKHMHGMFAFALWDDDRSLRRYSEALRHGAWFLGRYACRPMRRSLSRGRDF